MVFLSIKCRICRYFLIQLLVCKMSWNLSLKFCFSGVGHYSAGTAGRYRKEKEGGRLLGGRKWPRLRGLCKKIAFWALSLLLSKYKAMGKSGKRQAATATIAVTAYALIIWSIISIASTVNTHPRTSF